MKIVQLVRETSFVSLSCKLFRVVVQKRRQKPFASLPWSPRHGFGRLSPWTCSFDSIRYLVSFGLKLLNSQLRGVGVEADDFLLCISPFFNRATEPRRRADVVRGSFREKYGKLRLLPQRVDWFTKLRTFSFVQNCFHFQGMFMIYHQLVFSGYAVSQLLKP